MSSEQQASSASIKLTGQTLSSFDAVKSHMMSVLPGIDPTNADVLRFAVNHAAQHVPAKSHRSEQG